MKITIISLPFVRKHLTLCIILSAFTIQLLKAQIVLQYDKSGNRVNKITKSFTHPMFVSTVMGQAYQWQQNTGSGFQNISNNIVFSGSNNIALLLHNPPTSWYGYQYRCLVNTGNGTVTTKADTLKFTAQWLGAKSIVWDSAYNWCCGVVPDSNVNVLITKGAAFYPTVNENIKIRGLKMDSTAAINIASGKSLFIRK